MIERLLEAGCGRTQRDQHGNQPWHSAAEAAQLGAMRLLQAKGCTCSLRNNSGWTALHYAAHAGGASHLAFQWQEGAMTPVTSATALTGSDLTPTF